MRRPFALFFALALLASPALAQEPQANGEPGWFDQLLRGAQQLLGGGTEMPADAEEVSRMFDAFLTFVIKHAARESLDLGLREDFLAALIDGRHDALSLVAGEIGADDDALRGLLQTSWPRLQPLVQQLVAQLGADQGASWQGLIDAGQALLPEQDWGVIRQLALSPESLRELARIIDPQAGADPLAFGESVDPELRQVFGFGAPLAPPLENPELEPDRPVLPPPLAARLVWAAELPEPVVIGPPDELSALAKRLNGWVPEADALGEYLPVMRRLLELAAAGALAAKPLEPEYHDLFRDLVLATAWKESCWRQFVRRHGKLQPIASGVGAVGIMQVYARVWRGFYDVEGLRRDAGYNARAGSEILHHYLRDYAIRKGEHQQAGGADNLARAAYAVYNGGPAHLRRYRVANTRRSLREIDASFYEKYRSVKAGDDFGVARCYGEAG